MKSEFNRMISDVEEKMEKRLQKKVENVRTINYMNYNDQMITLGRDVCGRVWLKYIYIWLLFQLVTTYCFIKLGVPK